nr:adenylate/guanylate cyclase domain-containing protein [Caldilineaceae bacterium]
METAHAYLPWDRHLALAHGLELPGVALGAVLFADISGFSPLFNALVQRYGARRGADELTQCLNAVYGALIAEVDRFGRSVINFSGDAITCWYAAHSPFLAGSAGAEGVKGATLRAVASALAMQPAIQPFQTIESSAGPPIRLALKTAVAAGWVHRYRVGNPAVQYIDVLAGTLLEQMAAAEQMAQKAELVLASATAETAEAALDIAQWRTDAQGARFAVVQGLRQIVQATPPAAAQPLPDAEVRRWVLPEIYRRLQAEQSRFLAELRPATALFLRFSGLDYANDPKAGDKLDAYVRWVQELVDRYEGALIQLTTGDKGSYLYAAFGAPIAHDDDIVRAVSVALKLRETSALFPFLHSVQIGLSQGMMRTGAYGSPTRRTYGVLGDVTGFAARLMTHAAPGQIVISQQIAEAIAHTHALEDLGRIKVKGWVEPQPAFALRGPHQQPGTGRWQRYASPL